MLLLLGAYYLQRDGYRLWLLFLSLQSHLIEFVFCAVAHSFTKFQLRLIRVATIELAVLPRGDFGENIRLGLRGYFLDLSLLRHFLDDARRHSAAHVS